MYCNKKYRSEMEQIFAFVDEAGKKLNRQIKDLDDIRIAMAALKEIREHQITIDFQVGPIEVKHRNMSLIQCGSFRPISIHTVLGHIQYLDTYGRVHEQ